MNKKILAKSLLLSLAFLCLVSCDKPFWHGSKTTGKKYHIQSKHTIILCHGLWGRSTTFNAIRPYLKQEFPRARVLTFREEKTYKLSIPDQSKRLVKFVKENIKEEELAVLVGHSQGGLKAHTAAQELKEKGYKVAGVLAIGTPWEGAEVVNNIDTFIAYLKANPPFDTLVGGLEAYRKGGLGVDDMKPNSLFLKNLKEKLKSNNIDTLAIGGDVSNLSLYRRLNSGVKRQLDTLIGGAPHDLLIPLSSQHAKNIKPKQFKTATFAAIHTNFAKLFSANSEHANKEIMIAMRNFIGDRLEAHDKH